MDHETVSYLIWPVVRGVL